MLGDGTPARIGKVGAGVGVPMRQSSVNHLCLQTCRLGGLLDNPVAVVRMHTVVSRSPWKTMVGTGGPPFAILDPPPCRMATNAEGRSLAPSRRGRNGYRRPRTDRRGSQP